MFTPDKVITAVQSFFKDTNWHRNKLAKTDRPLRSEVLYHVFLKRHMLQHVHM